MILALSRSSRCRSLRCVPELIAAPPIRDSNGIIRGDNQMVVEASGTAGSEAVRGGLITLRLATRSLIMLVLFWPRASFLLGPYLPCFIKDPIL
jgi:hypothetical protein